MKHYPTVTLIAYFLGASLFLPTPALAGKAKFERTKPHVNIGTIEAQESRFLMHVPAGPVNSASCHSFGMLTGRDISPDSEVGPLIVIAEDVEIEPGGSVAILIKLPSSDGIARDSIADRREFSIEFEEEGNPLGPCPLITAAVGYDSITQATEYYIASVTHRISPASNDSAGPGDNTVFAFPVGFVGGNGDQRARFILDPRNNPDADSQKNGSGVQCDLSGTLRVRNVGVWGDPHISIEQEHSVDLQQGRIILDNDFNAFGASANSRVDLVAIYEFDAPLKLGACTNFLDISTQIINYQTGETAAAERPLPFYRGYRPQFYLR